LRYQNANEVAATMSEMLFVVGSAAGAQVGNPDFDLGHELDLVKTGLLYADRVELVSAGASMVYGFVALGEVPPKERLGLLREHAPANAGYRLTEEQLEKMDLLMGGGSRRQRRSLSKRQRAETRRHLQAVADEVWRQFVREAEERFKAYNARGLEDALGSGLLELHTFGSNTVEGMLSMVKEGFRVDTAVEDILREYVDKASIAMEGDGYPLFDDLIGRMVGEAVRDGLIAPPPSAVHRGRHGGLSGDLLGRLPLFEEASVADILDVRR
jgi:hypothetical protein